MKNYLSFPLSCAMVFHRCRRQAHQACGAFGTTIFVATAFVATAILELCAPTAAWAQIPQARNGMGGVCIVTGDAIVSPETPDSRGVVGYNIYRKNGGAGGAQEWTKLNATPVRRAASRDAFARYLGQNFLNEVAAFYSLSPDEAWQAIQTTTARKTSKVPAIFLDPRSMAAFGEIFVDSTAQANVLYEYAVAPLTAAGNELPRETRGTAQKQNAPPEFVDIAIAKAQMLSAQNLSLRYTFVMNSGALYGFEILRARIAAQGAEAAFQPIASVLRSQGAEDPSLIFIDSTVVYGAAYRYTFVPFDAFYNKGRARDTLTVLAALTQDLPLAQNLLATSTTAGIKLTWNLQKPPAPEYRGTIILRSREQNTFDGEYAPLDTVGYAQTEYIDRYVAPMDKYFYRLQTLAVDMSVSPPSAYYGAMYEMGRNKTDIPPPTNLRGESTKDGVRLRWSPLRFMPVEGYYVYRAMSAKDSLELISKIVKDSTFLDSAKHLNPYSPYYYAVATVNGSFVWGEKSERIAVRHDANAQPEAPATPAAYLERGAVVVQWSNEAAERPFVAGYNIYRREEGKAPVKLNAAPLPPTQTLYRDVKPPEDAVLLYAVAVVDAAGKESPLSPVATVENRLPDLRPPSRVQATPTRKGVTLRWARSSDARITGYEIFRAAKNASAVSVGLVKAEVSEFTDASAKTGETYFYTVVSVGAKNRSRPSAEISALP
jgi:fibronectin type 3 domain-containing protein